MITKAFDVVCFGEVLWDVLPSGAKPGGAPMNVAYHLQKMGMHPALVSRIGNDDWGRRLLQVLTQNGISTAYIQHDKEHATGMVQATLQLGNEVSYDILYPVAWDFIEWSAPLSEAVEKATFFVCGSLGARHRPSQQTLFQLLEAARYKVVDINLRPPHFNQPLIESLLTKADVLKLNEHELPLVAGWYTSLSTVNDQVKWLQDRFSISAIIVTRGGEGALVCKEGALATHQGYKVRVADTVGSGDAFLAAFLYKNQHGASAEESLEFANALAAFVASQTGACPPYTKETADLFFESVREG